jgi:LysM repeat protein
MRPSRLTAAAVILLFSLIVSPALALNTTPELPQQETTAEAGFENYTVQSGDTLTNIAERFGTDAATLAADNNIGPPYNIFPGQILRIRSDDAPQPAATAAPLPTATISTEGTQTYIVQPNDTLFRIATRFNTTVAELVQLNNLANENLIYTGQELLIPGEGDESSEPAATAIPPVEEATAIPPTTLPLVTDPGFNYGIEVFMAGNNAMQVVENVSQLGMQWVKVEIDWRIYEPVQGQIEFTQIDTLVAALEAQNISILFSVSTSPDWARTSDIEEGPPDVLNDYANFAGALAQRYTGRVAAYEIWTEPNLRREWNSETHSIGADNYIDLLTLAFNAVKSADPTAIVVSAGLAPTGFNDGINAINDREFLQGMYGLGLADVSDAVGAHPGGWANPPDATCCDASPGVETHFEHPSFYFLDTLNNYREIMIAQGDTDTPIWVTEFGWGTSTDMVAPAENSVNIFVTYTDLNEQAFYTPQAFEIAVNLGYVGPMFLYNLNGCQARPGNAEVCYYSLIGPNGVQRPVFSAVEAIDKSVLAAPPVAPPVVSPVATEESASTEAPTAAPPESTVPPTEAPTTVPSEPVETLEAIG